MKNTYDHFRHSVPITHTNTHIQLRTQIRHMLAFIWESRKCSGFHVFFCVFIFRFSVFIFFFSFFLRLEAIEEKYYTCKHNWYVELGLFLSTDAASRCFIIIDFLCITRYAVSFSERTKWTIFSFTYSLLNSDPN